LIESRQAILFNLITFFETGWKDGEIATKERKERKKQGALLSFPL
jgi:hypothetical protein